MVNNHSKELEIILESQNLSAAESAMLLNLSPSIDLIRSHDTHLFKDVLGKNNQWILDEKLSNVAIRLLALHRYKPSVLDGSVLALFLKRLLDSEDQVGGPYSSDSEDKYMLNALISQLFIALNAPLENVNSYLKMNSKNNLNYLSTAFGRWSVTWPHTLIPKIPNQSQEKEHSIKSVISSWYFNESIMKSAQFPTPHRPDPIARAVKLRIDSLDPTISEVMQKIWKVIVDFDKNHEITYLSKYFLDSLITKPKISKSRIAALGEANFYAWMAYSVYDDILDGENTTYLLPIANILHRYAIAKYEPLYKTDLIGATFDEVDAANLQELSQFRFKVHGDIIYITHVPDYRNNDFIASTAIGHILGPQIIVANYTDATKQQKSYIDIGFREYLIARKINDDAHDWIEDLSKGHASLVICYLLESLSIEPGEYDIHDLIKKMKTYFWRNGLQEITDMTVSHIDKSRESFLSSGLVKADNTLFHNILEPIKEAALEGSKILKNQKDFLNTFTKVRD